MTDSQKDAKNVLLTTFARDLCTKTQAEILDSWKGTKLDALEKIEKGRFDRQLDNHNPIYYLAQNVWFANNPSLLHAPLHRDRICSEVLQYLIGEDEETRGLSGLLILVQRDSFKSTFMHGVVPMWFSMRKKYVDHVDVRILLTHQREEQASLNLKKIKQVVINSEYLRSVWNDRRWKFTATEDFGTSTKFDWPSKIHGRFHESSITAAGVGGRLVGMHFDLKCNDDLVDDEQRTSKIVRDKTKELYAASRYMLDTLTGKEINSGTPYHIHDLWNKLRISKDKSGNPIYKSIIVGAGGKHTDQPLSFPNRHTQEFLDKKLQEIKERDGHDTNYWAQMQCEPRSSTMIAAETSWIKYIDETDLPKNLVIAILVDPAWKGTDNAGQGCDAAIAVVGFERRQFLTLTYLLDLVVSNEMTANDGMEEIFKLMQKFYTTEVGVEENTGHGFRTNLEREAIQRGKFVHLLDFKTKKKSKSERIVTFLQVAQAGRFFISNSCRNQEIFLSQYEDFPQVDKNDALDAVSYSADPSVAELCAPRFNSEAQGYDWYDSYSEPQRTRYTSL